MFLHWLRNYPRNHYSGIQVIMPSTNAGLTSILQRKKPNVNIFFCSFWGSPHQIIFLQLPFSQTSSSITPTSCMSSFATSINPPIFLLPGSSTFNILCPVCSLSLLCKSSQTRLSSQSSNVILKIDICYMTTLIYAYQIFDNKCNWANQN